MPNRIIHEKCVRSKTLARLSAEAERLFWRLTVVADDQGRFDAEPSTVKADCFRCMVDVVKTHHVAEWLIELSNAKCVRIYIIHEHPYGVFCKWKEYQRIYGNKPKFPEPPAEICGEMPQPAGDCGELRENPALILIPTSTSITTSTLSPTGKPAGREKGKVAFPDEWKPSVEELDQWKRHGIPNPAVEFACFRDHAKATDRRCKDWAAAWRNWCRKAIKMAQGGNRWPV